MKMPMQKTAKPLDTIDHLDVHITHLLGKITGAHPSNRRTPIAAARRLSPILEGGSGAHVGAVVAQKTRRVCALGPILTHLLVVQDA